MIKSSPSTSFKTIKALVERSSSENIESDENEEITNKTNSPFTATTTSTSNDDDDDNDETKTCSEPSINDFPTDIFTQTQRRFGAILFHIAFVVYLCDDYFFPSLECISERLQLDQDVTGATFIKVSQIDCLAIHTRLNILLHININACASHSRQ